MSTVIEENGMKTAEFWEPRRALTLDAARRHSSLIRMVRFGLIGCSALLVMVLLWYFISAPATTPIKPSADETVKMVNPVYKGRTSDGLPYRIVAGVAVRFLQRPDEVKLEKPVLNFLRTEGVAESRVLAQSGLYNSKDQILNLKTEVNLQTDDGYVCLTDHSRVNINDKNIIGDKQITCTGSFGLVRGQAYEVNDNYSEFIYKNGMTARLLPSEADASLRGSSTLHAERSKSVKPVSFSTDKPVDVSAQTAIYKGAKIVLLENVDVRQEDIRIVSDKMDLYREEIGKKDDGTLQYGDVQKMVATGKFKYWGAQNSVSGHKGVYERNKNIITVTGKAGTVRYTQANGDSITGCKLVYDLTTSRAKFDGRCGNTTQKGRVVIQTKQ